VSQKTVKIVFRHNFVKFPPTLTIFDIKHNKDSQDDITMYSALIYHLTWFMSMHYCVKHRCSKLLHYAAIICIRWLTFASSIQQRVRR